jgi:hypothetical protein
VATGGEENSATVRKHWGRKSTALPLLPTPEGGAAARASLPGRLAVTLRAVQGELWVRRFLRFENRTERSAPLLLGK